MSNARDEDWNKAPQVVAVELQQDLSDTESTRCRLVVVLNFTPTITQARSLRDHLRSWHP